MLKLHSFLLGIRSKIKELHLESYKSCISMTAITLVVIILILSSESFNGRGSNIVEAYAMAGSLTDVFARAEETDNEAQIQADNLEKGHQEDNLMALSSVRTINGMAQIALEEIEEIPTQDSDDTLQAAKLEENRRATVARTLAEEQRTTNAKQAKEKKKKNKIENAKEKTAKSAGLELTKSDIGMLERIVEAEATGEDIKGRMLVANVILNRVKSGTFPNTVEGVIFQKSGNTYQFSPIKDKRYWSVTVSKDTKNAVERVLAGEDNSRGALYFSARDKAKKSSMSWFDNHLTWLFKHGGHEFYK